MTISFKKLPSLQYLRAAGGQPRVHGNGFIQLDIDADNRLHVWGDPRVPRQRVASPHHDHMFSFTSTVYRGRMVHVEYGICEAHGGAYSVWEAVMAEGHDTKLVLAVGIGRVNLMPRHTMSILPGDSYSFERLRIHEPLIPELTVTIMRKHGKTLADGAEGRPPRVFLPYGQEPDNDFDRHAYDEQMLWQIIAEAVA